VRIRPTDVQTLLAVAVLLVMITVLASFLPAWRTARTDPLHVLRSE
jgi:ABC-type lipoprotein release transport system permease subunit